MFEKYLLQISLHNLSSDFEKQLLFHIWTALVAKEAVMEAVQGRIQITASDLFEMMEMDQFDQNLDRGRGIIKQLLAVEILIDIIGSNGVETKTRGMCFQGIKLREDVTDNPLDTTITFLLSDFIVCGFNPKNGSKQSIIFPDCISADSR